MTGRCAARRRGRWLPPARTAAEQGFFPRWGGGGGVATPSALGAAYALAGGVPAAAARCHPAAGALAVGGALAACSAWAADGYGGALAAAPPSWVAPQLLPGRAAPFFGRLAGVAPLRAEHRATLDRVASLTSRVANPNREARAWLAKLKTEKPDAFSSVSLFVRVHALLATYPFSLPTRRFVDGLFDRVSFSDKTWASLQGAE
jgi:hypothetical protein